MRHLAVGDIHGCFTALRTLAELVPFRDDDVIITLGDYVDRGPNSFAVLDWVIARARRRLLIPLRGNHEIMMLRARDGGGALDRWLAYGGDATLASYCPWDEAGEIAGMRDLDAGKIEDVPDTHWDFLENGLRPWFETETHFFVHANAAAGVPLAEQPDYLLYWESFGDPVPHMSGKIMVCGHTAQKSGRPRDVGCAVCIDTWVYGQGWLTCLNPATGEYWQANERGETRRDGLGRRDG